ncbi:Ribosomal RNA small subunit methyltransferase G [Frankliniella fusca]|uniref:Ribosomal RNA small subunit methyltransferase G n=1 Tax=Frankliniella fusca TaxID=407009 RepID=A0AAE1HS53_9NEOP|nr:Ribosomal RNA small subunit methyltransferase G [Frankliniella fusca]
MPCRRRQAGRRRAFSTSPSFASAAGAPAPGWTRRLRPTTGLALAGALALLAPGLALGALLHVNDILSADLLPGTLFLREQLPPNGTGTPPLPPLPLRAAGATASRPRADNWTDAFLTMNFHRRMMNEYLCRSYVAEQILGDMTGAVGDAAGAASAEALTASDTTPAPQRRISSTLLVDREAADGRPGHGHGLDDPDGQPGAR